MRWTKSSRLHPTFRVKDGEAFYACEFPSIEQQKCFIERTKPHYMGKATQEWAEKSPKGIGERKTRRERKPFICPQQFTHYASWNLRHRWVCATVWRRRLLQRKTSEKRGETEDSNTKEALYLKGWSGNSWGRRQKTPMRNSRSLMANS